MGDIPCDWVIKGFGISKDMEWNRTNGFLEEDSILLALSKTICGDPVKTCLVLVDLESHAGVDLDLWLTFRYTILPVHIHCMSWIEH